MSASNRQHRTVRVNNIQFNLSREKFNFVIAKGSCLDTIDATHLESKALSSTYRKVFPRHHEGLAFHENKRS